MLNRFRDEAWKAELRAIEQRRGELTHMREVAEPTLPALHPKMGDLFRQKTETLAVSLESGDARQALRGFLGRSSSRPAAAYSAWSEAWARC